VHAIERLQGLGYPIDFKRGSLKDNVTLCRQHGIANWRTWWARTLAFDAIIGNTDRHTENWGFLIERASACLR
jgi:serine/threonine protein kinase HipA of HipAB toxin-antitoxin module